ncbi:MAG: hypothetical protein C0614_04635 [Desulfuromonas sp.]|nr:MAG: hypothetical protein C0614_04635 [Desulfuromonas sp.]
MFTLHPQLAQDTLTVGDLPLCRLLLMNDSNYPWLILVPRRHEITEIYQLDDADQQQFIKESSVLSQALARLFCADKINVAALGNLVPQLHIHHVVRYHNDPAWPKPVWGLLPARPYPDGEAERLCHKVAESLGGLAAACNEDL